MARCYVCSRSRPGHEDGWGSWRVPDKAAVFRARRKLGAELFLELLVHAGAAADGRAPGAFWRRPRVMAIDGTTLAMADTAANEAALGRVRA
ncbi:hypothetical protein [Actinacidiphila soli]|uniref:hypothetical protein n=1 Tax=Actinacidiphila soli TaxID=2487275 RepID=UPI001F0C4F00|nr:hypothetical protein [Actinacidiphila soli]